MISKGSPPICNFRTPVTTNSFSPDLPTRPFYGQPFLPSILPFSDQTPKLYIVSVEDYRKSKLYEDYPFFRVNLLF